MKRKTFFLISFLAVGIIIFVLNMLINVPQPKIAISGNEANNDYNNSIFNPASFVRIGNHLYYNFQKNIFKYGTVEISETGVKIVDKSDFRSIDIIFSNLIREYHNELYMLRQSDDKIRLYSTKTNTFTEAGKPFSFFAPAYSNHQFSV